jgi:hypothetical protein
VSLTWNAPHECPPGEAVLADVQRMLGSTSGRSVAARADVTEVNPEHWSVHLTTDVEGAQGERTIEANSCASLATATALILAWTVDPSRARAPPPPPQANAGVAPEAAGDRAEPSTPRGRSMQSEPFAGLVAATGAFDVGTLPTVGTAGEITVGALLGPVRAEVSGAYWLPQDATRGTSEGTHIHLLDARVRGCFRIRLTGTLELDPCLGAAIIAASSEGFGPAATFTPYSQRGAWGAAGGEALAAWRLFGPVALRASVGVWFPLAPPSFVIDVQNQGQAGLHTSEPVGGRATLGVEVRFP